MEDFDFIGLARAFFILNYVLYSRCKRIHEEGIMKKNKLPFIPLSAALCFTILGINTPNKSYASEKADETETVYSEKINTLEKDSENSNKLDFEKEDQTDENVLAKEEDPVDGDEEDTNLDQTEEDLGEDPGDMDQEEDPSEEEKEDTEEIEDEEESPEEDLIEWDKLTEDTKDAEEVIEDETRYNKLESTKENDNSGNEALYEKKGGGESNTVNIEFIDKSPDTSRFGAYLRYKDKDNNIFFGYDKQGWFWEYKLDGTGDYYKGARVAAPVMNEKNQLMISLKDDGQLNATNNGENLIDTFTVPENIMKTLDGFKKIYLKLGTWGDETSSILVKTDNQENIDKSIGEEIEKADPIDDSLAEYDSLENENISIEIDTKFPRIKEYTYKGKTMPGNLDYVDTLKVNDVEIKPQVTFEKISNTEALYTMDLKNEEEFIDARLKLKISLEGDYVDIETIDIVNNNNIEGGSIIDNRKLLLESIDFRNNFLLSLSDKHEDPRFDGAVMSTNTHRNGDIHLKIENPMVNFTDQGLMYGFLSDENLSGAVWSNSQFSYGGGANDYTRLTLNKKTYGEDNYLGISSSPYLYQRAYAMEDGSFKVYDDRTLELPHSRVILAEDLNSDGIIDWQDGAIAYRDIMNNPMGSEYVKDLVSHRIAMNFGSQAQNPFLMTADNIKKIYLHTDGLGQSIILKGYGSEGHDSGHLNYEDIGKRMGGVEDFNKLMEIAQKYNAKMGIHVNASETYPESKYFTEDRLRKDANGNYAYGWNWLDQGININASYDLAHGRFDRFKDLNDLVGDGLDFIYVDVWGNGQSGDNSAWMTHVLAKELNDLGYRATFEWGYAGEYDSTFQHWAADLTYGGYSLKGINSNIVRFIRNHQKDSFVGNFPNYGGAALNPLLGGYDMKDFEGWQGRNDYDAYINKIFSVNLPTKFVQQFKVIKWENGDPVKLSDNGETYMWTPEMKITLQNDEGDLLTIERLSNDPDDPGYMQRIMKLNGNVVYAEDDSYLIPWQTEDDDQKLYFFSPVEKTQTWDLPQGFDGEYVYVYELTDLGKVNEKRIQVVDNQISLDLKENTGYVIYKTPQEKEDVEWSEGMHMVDTGFNSGSLDHWEKNGDQDSISIEKSQAKNPMLKISDSKEDTVLTQKITGLKANTKYAIMVGVDNRSDEKASIIINNGYDEFSNYTKKSIAKNYIQAYEHNTNSPTVDGNSYFQNMYVFFTTGDKVDDVTVSLKRDKGAGATYFDGLRIVENNASHFDGDHDSKDSQVFFQDFENVAQGIFPFVIGNVEGVTDNRTHLAEKHQPYTQRGWNDKVISDVIGGDWSVKTNGLVGRNKLVYQTIPQNFRFEEGISYEVEFDYEAGSDGTYAFVIGQGEYKDPSNLKVTYLDNTWENSDKAKNVRFYLDGGEDVWVGILSTSKASDTKGTSGGKANFASYNDFMLDNLKISQIEMTSDIVIDSFLENFNYPSEEELAEFTQESVNNYQNKTVDLLTVNKDELTVDEAKELVNAVNQAKFELEKRKISIQKDDIESTSGSFQPGQEIEKAFDMDLSSQYHSKWGVSSIGEPIIVELKDPMEINSLTYIPRQSGSNGNIKTADLTIVDDEGQNHEFTIENWINDNKEKTFDFGKTVKAKTIILDVKESYGNSSGENDKFISAREFIYKLANPEKGYLAYDTENFDKLIESLQDVENLGEKDQYLEKLLENYDLLKKYGLINEDLYQKALDKFENLSDKDDEDLTPPIDEEDQGEDGDKDDNEDGDGQDEDDKDDQDEDGQGEDEDEDQDGDEDDDKTPPSDGKDPLEKPSIPGGLDKDDETNKAVDKKVLDKINTLLQSVEEKVKAVTVVREYFPESYKKHKDQIDLALRNAQKAIRSAIDFLKLHTGK